jgi:hypothetical protein
VVVAEDVRDGLVAYQLQPLVSPPAVVLVGRLSLSVRSHVATVVAWRIGISVPPIKAEEHVGSLAGPAVYEVALLEVVYPALGEYLGVIKPGPVILRGLRVPEVVVSPHRQYGLVGIELPEKL